MRRRRASAPFSLFAFQDIVTSVTAIVLLLTLLLTVELVTRRRSELLSATAPTAAELAQVAREIEAQRVPPLIHGDLESLREMLEQRERQASTRMVAAVARQERLETRVSKLRQDTNEAETNLTKARRSIERTQLRRQQAALDSARARNLKEANDRTALDLKQRREQASLRPGPPDIVFRPEGGEAAWLIIAAGESVEALAVSGGNAESFQGQAAAARCCGWMKQQVSRGSLGHAVLLVRPSGIESGDEIRAFAESNGIRIGLEVIGEGQQVRVAS